MRVATFIGLRYAHVRHGSPLLSFIGKLSKVGLVIAVALLIAVLAVMNGFDRELKERILRVVPALTITAVEGDIDDWQRIGGIVQAMSPQISGFAPIIDEQGLIVAGNEAEPVVVFATDPAAEQQLSQFNEFVSEAAWLRWQADSQSVLLSEKMATKLQLSAGDTAVILLPAGGGDTPEAVGLQIAGTYNTGTEIDNHLLFAQLPVLQHYLKIDGVKTLRFALTDLLQANNVAWDLAGKLPAGYQLNTWFQTHGGLYQAIQMSKQLVTLILVVIIAVAAFNVICSMILIVTDKKGAIAILKAMGLPRSQIMHIFLWHGLVIGWVGTFIGVILGCLLALSLPNIAQLIEQIFDIQLLSTDIYPVNYLPSDLRWQDVLTVASVSVGISGLASIYPAWRAANLKPAEVLNHE